MPEMLGRNSWFTKPILHYLPTLILLGHGSFFQLGTVPLYINSTWHTLHATRHSRFRKSYVCLMQQAAGVVILTFICEMSTSIFIFIDTFVYGHTPWGREWLLQTRFVCRVCTVYVYMTSCDETAASLLCRYNVFYVDTICFMLTQHVSF